MFEVANCDLKFIFDVPKWNIKMANIPNLISQIVTSSFIPNFLPWLLFFWYFLAPSPSWGGGTALAVTGEDIPKNAFCKLLFKRAKYFLSFLFVLTQKETKKSRRFDTTHKPPLLARSARPPHASSWEDLYWKEDCSSERECKIGISARIKR